MNFPQIYKAVKLTVTTVLILPSLFTFNINSAQASLDAQAIDRVNNLSLTVENNRTQSQQNNPDRSIQDRQIEMSAQSAENYDKAVEKIWC
jgi:hypothetical protein